MRLSKMSSSAVAALLLLVAAQPAQAASEDDVQTARRYLRCAAFYISGINEVSKPELKQQLQQLANLSLYSAEVLMDKDRPRVKDELETAKKKLVAESQTTEVKANMPGFMQYMGEHCSELRKNHPVPLPQRPQTDNRTTDQR